MKLHNFKQLMVSSRNDITLIAPSMVPPILKDMHEKVFSVRMKWHYFSNAYLTLLHPSDFANPMSRNC